MFSPSQQNTRRLAYAKSVMVHVQAHSSKCKTCDKNMTDMSKSRACPQPHIIQKYLGDNTEFSGEICSNDRICYAWYKSHIITNT